MEKRLKIKQININNSQSPEKCILFCLSIKFTLIHEKFNSRLLFFSVVIEVQTNGTLVLYFG